MKLKGIQLDLLRQMREEDDTVNDSVKADASELSKTDQSVLAAISSFLSYSYEKLAESCSLSRPTIARAVRTLQEKGFICRIGSNKTGHWEIIKK